MPLRLFFTKSAERDIEGIATFIARENPAAAARFVRDLRQRAELLTEFPASGRARDELRSGARTLAFDRKVLILYRIGPDSVRILRVRYKGSEIHGR